MPTVKKLIRLIKEKPTRNDITKDDLIRVAEYYGFTVKTGGNHQIAICSDYHKRPIPIPDHGKFVKEAYVRLVAELIEEIESDPSFKGGKL